MSGQWVLILDSCSFKWPYQAKVIKILEQINNKMVYSPFMVHRFVRQNYIFSDLLIRFDICFSLLLSYLC